MAQAMISHVLADARDHPVVAPYHHHWRQVAEVLTEPWREGGRRRALLRAGIAVALSFDTWRILTREQHLSDNQAVELMLRLTCDCAHDPGERTSHAPVETLSAAGTEGDGVVAGGT